jgi:protein-tyrosine-phosphatase
MERDLTNENVIKTPPHVVFVCIANRVRSAFAEFLFAKMLAERDEILMNEVKVSSAGFIPQKLRDQLAKVRICFSEPFYNRPMAETTRAALLKKDIAVSADWRSKELSPEMVEDADLIITALPEQKEELVNLFPEARSKIFTTREISKWDEYLIFEHSTRVPLDHTFWDYVEENPDYVSKVIMETEETLVRAFPNIFKQLGVRE